MADLRRKARSRWVGVVLALVNQGAAFVYTRQWRMLAMMLGIGLSLPGLLFTPILGWRFGFLFYLLLNGVYWLAFVGLAMRSVWRTSEVAQLPQPTTLLAYLGVIAFSPLLALSLEAFGSKHLPYRVLSVPAASMKPTIIPGDFIIVQRFGFEGVKPGDVITFLNPRDLDQHGKPKTYVKRLVASGPATVQMVDNKLHLDGGAVELSLLSQLPSGVQVFQERLAEGTPHSIWTGPVETGFENTALTTLPVGQHFVLGDNRDRSADSRSEMVGLVGSAQIEGRVVRIGWSWADWRRTGQRIN